MDFIEDKGMVVIVGDTSKRFIFLQKKLDGALNANDYNKGVIDIGRAFPLPLFESLREAKKYFLHY